MFVVEYLMTAFNKDGGIIEQERNTKYFDDLDKAMNKYHSTYYFLCDLESSSDAWDVYVVSLFGGSELLKMQTIRHKED